MKDNFSKQSALYAKFRPSYPQELFNFILSQVPTKNTAWDCGTGNGQIASKLANYFTFVYASDISENQLKHAVAQPNVIYRQERAEETSFPDNLFDLVTVSQAVHWFDFDEYYHQVKRTLKPGGIIAVIGYSVFKTDEAINNIIDNFYNHLIGPYWDPERKYIDELYQTIPFPFTEIKAPTFTAEFKWTFDQLIGYMSTWSAVQHYITKNGANPLDNILEDLKKQWPTNELKPVRFNILLRLGKFLPSV